MNIFIHGYDVINNNSELYELTRFLLKEGGDGNFYTVNECKKIYEAKRKDVQKRLCELPARIDEANRALTDEDGDVDVLLGTLSLLQKDLDEELVKKASVTKESLKERLKKELSDIKGKIFACKK